MVMIFTATAGNVAFAADELNTDAGIVVTSEESTTNDTTAPTSDSGSTESTTLPNQTDGTTIEGTTTEETTTEGTTNSGVSDPTTTSNNADSGTEVASTTSEETVVEDVEENVLVDFNAMAVADLYNYLINVTNDAEYFTIYESLSESKKIELANYTNQVTKGEEITIENTAVVCTAAAPLVSTAVTAASKSSVRRVMRMARTATFNTENKTPDEGLVMTKEVTNYDSETGMGTLRLESYVTGEVKTVDNRVPIDVVLVLDQSGSMENDISGSTYIRQNYTNGQAYNNRNELFIKNGTEYEAVTVTRTEASSDYARTNSISFFNLSKSSEKYYYKNTNGNYVEVSVSSTGWGWNQEYQLIDSQTGEVLERSDTPYRAITTPLFKKVTTYNYTYSGNSFGTKTSTGVNTNVYAETGLELYIRKTTLTRLDALADAVTRFTDSVKADAAAYSVDHRIAIAGFSSDGYNNTEILTGVDIRDGKAHDNGNNVYYPQGIEKNGVQKGASDYTDSVKRDALQSVTGNGATSITNAIAALTAHGGTQTDHGLAMAADIFSAQNATYQNAYANGTRKKVVIVFTDGVPTGSGSDWNGTVAGNAITTAHSLKSNNTTIYSVGIFNSADGSINQNKKPNAPTNWNNPSSDTAKANKFMHLISSNYITASSMSQTGNINASLTPKNQADLSQGYNSYYLSANDSASLNAVFESISSQIGGAQNTSLTETTVVQDVISQYFELPKGTNTSDIKVYTADCTAVAGSGSSTTYTFGNDTVFTDAKVTTSGNTIQVTNFNFSENYVGSRSGSAGGKKLIIEIPIHYKNEACFGGNNIPTNGATSGIYDATGTTCYGNFEQPMVNQPINYKIASADQTIYLTNSADLEELLAYAENYTPDGIKNAFVDITYTLKDATGTTIATLTIPKGTSKDSDSVQWAWKAGHTKDATLNDCTSYTLECTVTPDDAISGNHGTVATTKNYSGQTPTVHVLKPTIACSDQYIFLGDTVTNMAASYPSESITWTDRDNTHTSIPDASGTKPTLTITPELVAGTAGDTTTNYKPTMDSDFKIASVKVGETPITDECVVTPSSEGHKDTCVLNNSSAKHDFTIHVVAGQIKITKTITKSNNIALEGSPVFTFRIENTETGTVWYRTVKFDTLLLTESAEVLSGLPRGTYTVTELDTQRFKLTGVDTTGTTCETSSTTESATFTIGTDAKGNTSLDATTGAVTFTNKKNENPGKRTDTDVVLNRFTKNADGTWSVSQIPTPQEPDTTTNGTTKSFDTNVLSKALKVEKFVFSDSTSENTEN